MDVLILVASIGAIALLALKVVNRALKLRRSDFIIISLFTLGVSLLANQEGWGFSEISDTPQLLGVVAVLGGLAVLIGYMIVDNVLSMRR